MSTAIAKPTERDELQVFLESRVGELAKACAGALSPEKQVQVAALLAYKTKRLRDCTPETIFLSMVQSASLGLSLEPSLGEAYLIPRWNDKLKIYECQFQPGYRGLAKLARRTGQVGLIRTDLVWSKDTFSYSYSPGLEFNHTPSLEVERGQVTHVYCHVKLTGGEQSVEVMTRADIEAIRARSQYPNAGPWASDWGEMARKTVLKRAMKSVDQSPDMARAIAADNAEYPELVSGEYPKLPPPQNDSGHGRGQYASPEQVETYLKAMDSYLTERGQKWLDHWQDEKTGEFPSGVKRELVNRWQADGHLVKWAVDCGKLDPVSLPETGIKNRQIGLYTAIVYGRSPGDRKALAQELRKYIDQQEERALAALEKTNPELFEPRADDVDADGAFEGETAG